MYDAPRYRTSLGGCILVYVLVMLPTIKIYTSKYGGIAQNCPWARICFCYQVYAFAPRVFEYVWGREGRGGGGVGGGRVNRV